MTKKQIITPTRLANPAPPKSARTASLDRPVATLTIPLRFSLKKVVGSRATKFLLAVIVLAAACLFSYHLGTRSGNSGTAVSGNLNTTDGVVQRVSRHILLPSGEQPTVATVSDVNKVRNQTFFAHAATGDKVLIYANAKKAYLYRPSIDRVIEVAPLAPNTSTPTSQSTDQSTGQ